MFTGIVQTKAKVESLTDKGNFRHLTVSVEPHHLDGVQLGASIAINGVCLTVVHFKQDKVSFDVIDETLRLTNLGELTVGSEVNFERSLRVGDEIGGHYVSGHIHCTASIIDIEVSEHNWSAWLSLPQTQVPYLFAKGFIAVNGASLTVGQVQDNKFSLHLIPETLRLTNLAALKPGDNVNIEMDQQTITTVTTVERVLAARGQ
ncbi:MULTISPECIES: riboflavin synthase subunit alpha [unclassified Idiomarina]|uniref:riboflavin synthase subunit alpha n=1 Tax=unclassified Idiomarina TaxID=2614829 RepID=UPI000C89C726|nr:MULTISPECIES: riboflavin synthase subunit alpha [unclassified Idiomarina]MAD54580.1 riboflavin synthase [Idiomarinaceae bacterium]NQZ04474.1 riboflavin synthase subunit alpha [Idiomarina sp.]|tara:strand:- start:1891 stop:2502 length:612 start_codon:yes stop_codon:yes gene_type:complete